MRHEPPAKYAPDKPRLVDIAILAAVLEPEKMRSKNPGPALARAAQLLDRLPEYLRFENLSRVQQRDRLSKQAAYNTRLARRWKMDKGPWLTLEQLIEQLIGTSNCRHKSVPKLKAMLKEARFPFSLETPKRPSDPAFPPTGKMTLAAYQYALKRYDKRRKKRKLENQQKRRAKQV